MIRVLHTFPLRSRLIIVYLFILGAGGLITSFIGSIIVNRNIMNQAKIKVKHDLKIASVVYNTELEIIKKAIYLVASGNTIRQALLQNNKPLLRFRLEQIAQDVDMEVSKLIGRQNGG